MFDELKAIKYFKEMTDFKKSYNKQQANIPCLFV